MENSSEISSELSSCEQEKERVPSIHLSQFLMEEHARAIATEEAPKIFTVAQTLKDPFILAHIKPDYGSLGEFMKDASLRKDFFNQKKKKIEGAEEESGQRKMRHLFKDKSQEDLNRIYLDSQSSAWERKMASKLMVESIFNDTFKLPINSFETQNAKQQLPKNVKIDLNQIDEIFKPKKDTIMRDSAQEIKQSASERRQASRDRDTEVQISRGRVPLNKRERLNYLKGLKQQYLSFKKIDLSKVQSLVSKIVDSNDEEGEEKNKKKGRDAFRGKIQCKQQCLILEEVDLTAELLFSILINTQADKLSSVILQKIRVKQQTLIFLINALMAFESPLKRLQISRTSLENNDFFVDRIKELLTVAPLKKLSLQYLGIEAKQFCVLALGVAESSTLEQFQLGNNEIDRTASKSLQLIARHCPSLKKIGLQKNYIEAHHLAHLPPEAKQKICFSHKQ